MVSNKYLYLFINLNDTFLRQILLLNNIILLIGIVFDINISLCQVQIPEDERELINIDDNYVNDDLLGDLEESPMKINALNKDILNDIYKKYGKYFFIKSRTRREEKVERITERNKRKFRPSPLLCG